MKWFGLGRVFEALGGWLWVEPECCQVEASAQGGSAQEGFAQEESVQAGSDQAESVQEVGCFQGEASAEICRQVLFGSEGPVWRCRPAVCEGRPL